jgi:DNA repair protein RecO (recombination protein O)
VKTLQTRAIILRRTNYGEADRIMNVITEDLGKVTLIAKGVRREKSRLAGGVELFSVSEISFVRGKSDISTLTSSRLVEHFDTIIKDYARTLAAYDFLKWISVATEDASEASYFQLLRKGLVYLNARIEPRLVRVWFLSSLLSEAGYDIELFVDETGLVLSQDGLYSFDVTSGKLVASENGPFAATHIKLLRLLRTVTPDKLRRVKNIEELVPEITPLVDEVAGYYLHIK